MIHFSPLLVVMQFGAAYLYWLYTVAAAAIRHFQGVLDEAFAESARLFDEYGESCGES